MYVLILLRTAISHILLKHVCHVRSKSDLQEKCIFTNISDQVENNEMKDVGGWEFELEKRELAKIVDANGRRPY